MGRKKDKLFHGVCSLTVLVLLQVQRSQFLPRLLVQREVIHEVSKSLCRGNESIRLSSNCSNTTLCNQLWLVHYYTRWEGSVRR